MHSATRQKPGSRAMRAKPRHWSAKASLRCAARSGTARKMSRLTSTVSATMPPKTSRQCSTRSSISSGTVAVSAPSMPLAKAMPFMVAMRSGGYHSVKAEKAAIRQPETPRPISARAAVSSAADLPHGEPGAARCGDEQQRGIDAPRPIAVEQHAERQLEQREAEEVDAGEQPQAGGREAQLARDLRADDRVDRAVDVGNEIPRQERQGDAEEKKNRVCPYFFSRPPR